MRKGDAGEVAHPASPLWCPSGAHQSAMSRCAPDGGAEVQLECITDLRLPHQLLQINEDEGCGLPDYGGWRRGHDKAPVTVHPVIPSMVPLLLVEGLLFDQRCLGRQS